MFRFTRLRAAVLLLGVLLGGSAIASGLGAHLLVRTGAGATIRRSLNANGIVYGDATNGVSSTAALTDGQVLVGASGAAPSLQALSTFAISHPVRGVVTSNVSLTGFTGVSGGSAVDGITYAQGERVFLANQTTKSQNGPYVVGAVAAGSAPLSRPADFATGTVIPSGTIFEVSEGTLFAQSTWKITTAGGITVDTTSFDAYPRLVTQTVTLASGTATLTNVPVLSASKSTITLIRTTPSGTTSTVMYGPSALTPGIVGTASATVQAEVAAGSINTADASTLLVTIINW